MSFWGSLWGGSSPELNTLIGQYGQIGGNLTGQGQSNVNKASDFYSSILSGDSSKQSQALAPEISAAKKSAQEQNKTTAEFGGRSGGTAASTAMTNDKTHEYLTNLIGRLTGKSADALGSLGTSELSTGLGALGQEQGASQQRMENWSNSILGLGLTKGAGFAEGLGLSGIAGMLGKSGSNNNNDDNS
jgi:hypothetical protein